MKIPINAFRFCRFGVMIMVWVGLLWRIEELIVASFVILALSAYLGVKNAPMVWLWTNTIERFWKSKRIDLDYKGMKFAHTLGAIFSGICVALVYTYSWGWGVVFIFALMKSISALGFCPGEKVYKCMKGGCCKLRR